MSEPVFAHAERDLAQTLGLGHSTLRALRRDSLERGTDWNLIDNRVCYSDEGRRKALAVLKISDGPPLPLPPPAPAGAPAAVCGAPLQGEMRDLVCEKKYSVNRRVVEAKLGEETVLVRVRDSVNLLPGMTMKCRYSGEGRMWELAQRLPRKRGKW